ncbi:TetR/AcrR family transcriptional regulator [Vulcaniibacterium tengchongense]|uniref:TetR family transcriptional regulator n=1 Tax=Vulcaniibacterium tengchongense TaxID=1273429 RepID=A0A3N4W4R3_9GAMM|nr:TetR/AcrR family transcriptional regulator [Vulcaniibacterium tengchongense]RPE80224.1 TetR family transcriptional regulator [Vulcaniibacterium tengchongense]
MTLPLRKPDAPPAASGERAALLDAAERLFVAHGVAPVELGDVAAAAGLPLRAAARHFAGKDALLAGLRERFVADFCAGQRAAMERCRPGDWTGRLRAWIASGFHGYLDHAALHDVVFHDARAHDRIALQHNPVVDQLTELLQAGVEARAWVSTDPRMTAVIFFNALHAAADRVIAAGEPYERERPLRTLIGYFERSVQWWRQA